MKCRIYYKIKKKKFYYHDANIHDGSNFNIAQKKRELNDYIQKNLKKFE